MSAKRSRAARAHDPASGMVRITFDASLELRRALRYLSLETSKGYRLLLLEALAEKYPDLRPIIMQELQYGYMPENEAV